MRIGRKRRGTVFAGATPPKVKRRHITKGDLWIDGQSGVWVWRGYFRGWDRVAVPPA